MGPAPGRALGAGSPPAVAQDPDELDRRIAQADRRRRVRFRLSFAGTWLLLVGGLLLAIVTAKRFDPGFLALWAPYILAGVPLTVFISVASIALALPLATFGALGRLSSRAPVYATATLYVSVVRGTPLLVQILFVYLALPQMIPGASGVPLVALGILALGFNYGAYLTEIFRAGIEAVPRGQREAATALGMSERRIMRRIILPQAIRVVTPAIGNEFIAMIKDSALVSVLGVQELLWRAQTVGSSKFRALETLLLAAAVYWVLTIVFSFFQDWLERRMRRSNA